MSIQIKSIESFQGDGAVITIEGDHCFTSNNFENLLDEAQENECTEELRKLILHSNGWVELVNTDEGKEMVLAMVNYYLGLFPSQWDNYFTVWQEETV